MKCTPQKIDYWYYLSLSGQIAAKQNIDELVYSDLLDSNFVIDIWPMSLTNRENAWTMLVEALAAGADKERINCLASKWKCDNEDAKEYAYRVGVGLVETNGVWVCGTMNMFVEPDLCGIGPSALYAMANFCSKLGYKSSKSCWKTTFKQLVVESERRYFDK